MLPRPVWHCAQGVALLTAVVLVLGCRQGNPQNAALLEQQQQQYLAQVQQMQQQASQLDTSNNQLHVEIAQSRQQIQALNSQVQALNQRLLDTTQQLAGARSAAQSAESKLQTLEASTRQRGGATITANNSWRGTLPQVEIPGVEMRREDDVVRLEIQADRLFLPAGAQLHQNAFTLLDQVAQVISQSFPKQRIVIEGHTDPSPIAGGYSSTHQLSTLQANAVFEQFTRRNRLPAEQFAVMGFGANHPRFATSTPAGRERNKRIEIVIYPETIGQ